MPAQHTHPGFSNPNGFDQFLATNGSEENLVPVPSEYTPSHQSYYSPTPEPALKSHDGRSTRATSEGYQNGSLQGSLTNGHHTYYTASPPDVQEEFDTWFADSNTYLDDAAYAAQGQQIGDPGNDTYLEQDFGTLGDLSRINNVSYPVESEHSQSNPVSATSAGSAPYSERAHRHSTGTATISSSHLMSPVLTDASTRDGTTSPPDRRGHVKQEPGIGIRVDTVHQVSQYFPSQQTPPMTESSQHTSPDMFKPVHDVARAPSPMITVDQYARGDSPARSTGLKRSRRGSHSSHLSVQANIDSEDEDSDHAASRNVHDPVRRGEVGNTSIPNLKDQAEASQRAFKNADVVEWISQHSPVSDVAVDMPPDKPKESGHRRRARSVGAQKLSKANLESLDTTPVDTHIPGPGLLLDVSSVEESSEDSHASIEDEPIDPPNEALNAKPAEARPGVYNELPNQPWWYRAKAWQDPLYSSADPGVKMHPETAADAMRRFEQRNADIETISRVATWGTRRRSESDMRSLFRQLTITSEQDEEPESQNMRERAGSILQRLRPRRNSTLLKRKESNQQTQEPPTRPRLGEHKRSGSSGSYTGRKDSLTVPGPVQSGLKRMGSLNKRRQSPKLDTGRAVAAMANPLAAVGGSGPLSPGASSPTGPFAFMKRTRSRSDLNAASNAGGSNLAGMWSQQGGPPTPALAVPKTEEPNPFAGDDDDDDDDGDEVGIKMDLTMRHELIIPNLDGFRDHVRQVNPRLPRFLVDRIGQEQLRRYKKLLDFKKQHIVAINNRKCSSGKHCIELGGEPTYLPTKNTKEPDTAQTGFSVSGPGPSDEEVNDLAEGVVTQAQFPPGVPMPPVKRLPAEFECPLCYKVKKFNKPSDWSKHVHEDVQPFTCTFTHCAEPKSFKRKADWVRHENERHRQLEWWKCSMNDCAHICYRKDNFVQHLVREHKLPDSKPKTSKASKPGVRGPSAQKARSNKQAQKANEAPDENDIVWRLVEECRAETVKNPKEEPCKFCGNICPTWKKLTVHLAKHMEQISMPVLGIVQDKEVTADTIISPIENSQFTSQEPSVSPVDATNPVDPFPVTTGTSMPGGFATIPTQMEYLPDAPYQRTAPQTYPQTWTQQQRDAIAHVRSAQQVYQNPTAAHQFNTSPPHLHHQHHQYQDPRVYGTHPSSSSPESAYGIPQQHAGAAPPPPPSQYQTRGAAAGYPTQFGPGDQTAPPPHPPHPPFAASPTDETMYHQFPPPHPSGGVVGGVSGPMAQQVTTHPTSYPGAHGPNAGVQPGNLYGENDGLYHQQVQQRGRQQPTPFDMEAFGGSVSGPEDDDGATAYVQATGGVGAGTGFMGGYHQQ